MKIILASAITFLLILNINACAGEHDPVDKLSSELLQLAFSENPEEFAKKHGISLIDNSVYGNSKKSAEAKNANILAKADNSVKVVIVTLDGFGDIEKRYNLKKVKRHKNLIEAIVSIENLIPLSREPAVKYIRRPYKLWIW